MRPLSMRSLFTHGRLARYLERRWLYRSDSLRYFLDSLLRLVIEPCPDGGVIPHDAPITTIHSSHKI